MFKKLKELLLERFSLYEVKVIIKTRKDSEQNLTTVYDGIRAAPYVVVVHPVKHANISSRTDDIYEYAHVNLKYLVKTEAIEDLNNIKNICLHGAPETKEFRVQGLVAFVPRIKTLKKVK